MWRLLPLFLAGAACAPPPASLPSAAIALNRRGVEALEAGRLDDADARFRLALEYHGRFAEPRANLGVVMLRRGDLTRAEQHLRAAVQLNPEFDEAWSNLGVVLVGQGDLDGAVDAFERALALDPGLVDARRNLADLWMRTGRWREARAQLYRLVQLVRAEAPVGRRSRALLAYCELRLERPSAARVLAEDILGHHPEDPVARTVRGALHVQAGRSHSALQDLAAAEADPVVGFDARVRLASVRLSMGDLAVSARRIRALLAEAPDHDAVRLLAAWQAAGESRWSDAVRHARAVLERADVPAGRRVLALACSEADLCD